MEALKRQQVVNTAMEIFKEKGYVAASMKEIAEACGMAKGSIYKLFPSKEELFTAVFVACHQTMFTRARELDFEQQSPPKEKLRRKIEFQLQYMLENYYFTSEFKELPVKDNEHFIAAWKKKRVTLLQLHRDFFYEAYGETIESHIWDVVIIFRGMLREYLSYAIQKVISLPMAELSGFIEERMDAVVRDIVENKPTPVMNQKNVYYNELNPVDPHTRVATIQSFLDSLEEQIDDLPMAEHLQNELKDVIRMLRKELMQINPNQTLLRVYASYLENSPVLGPYARQLRYMI
ncbi:putative HTH-type transcriptional regulator YcnC [Paenibacillus sp. J23TS9]|uniref:TetR/AcrR family transcriptional regulator n=1 Tax=Paenibacillus sp. J23TS9 TaxID=2807193 RepID=UPI001B063697|nr:TetR/AcrR family transcriptional regulator [Paenibacillus sp. J23TS9]GIP30029.1 putative HTH-type transcriptional regulator YcnC [Paenibacillus sp. J23TS9]